jgi:flagellar protein FliO/FliZ
MSRIGVIGLALIASALTNEARAAEPEKPAGTNAPATAPSDKAAASTKPEAKEASLAKSEEGAAKDDLGEPARSSRASNDHDSLLPSEHKAAAHSADRPLALRKANEKPLELVAPPRSDGTWYKLGLCGLILAGAGWLLRKRGLLKPARDPHPMSIIGRTAIGVRSELIVVNIDGQKLLLGVTPSAISRLAVLPVADHPSLADPLLDPVDSVAQEPGFEGALKSAREKLEAFAARVKDRESPRKAEHRGEDEHEHEHEHEREHEREREERARKLEQLAARRELSVRRPGAKSQPEPAREEQRSRESRPPMRSESPRQREVVRDRGGEQAQSLLRIRQTRGR